MTPSKHPYYYNNHHHHHHRRTDNSCTTPSPPSSLLPPRRTRPPSLSLLQFNIHELQSRRVSEASANGDANDPISTNTKAGDDNENEGDVPIRSRNTSTCSHRSSNRSRSNLLLSDSEISVLDLGPSLGPEVDGAGAGPGSRSGSRSASLQVPGIRVGVSRRFCSSSSGCDGLSQLGDDVGVGDAGGDGEKKGRYTDVEGRDCDYGYRYGYEIDDDEGVGVGGQQHPVLVVPCDGDAVDDDAHGGHDGYAPAPAPAHGRGRGHDNDEHGTISSPLLVPLKTTRKAKRGVSWSKAFGV